MRSNLVSATPCISPTYSLFLRLYCRGYANKQTPFMSTNTSFNDVILDFDSTFKVKSLSLIGSSAVCPSILVSHPRVMYWDRSWWHMGLIAHTTINSFIQKEEVYPFNKDFPTFSPLSRGDYLYTSAEICEVAEAYICHIHHIKSVLNSSQV